jgi:hypothetical protein
VDELTAIMATDSSIRCYLCAALAVLTVGFLFLSCASRYCAGAHAISCPPRNPEDQTGIPDQAPRCAPTQPECGPIPFGNRTLAKSSYKPGARRIVCGRIDCDEPCQHDGECVYTGCGYRCVSTHGASVGDFYTCEGQPRTEAALRDHFCGCVNGACAWFHQ